MQLRTTSRSATIDDVARIAGVSIATVSRALSSPSLVARPTRDRVMKAVGKIGYSPNAAARQLRSRKSMMVMVVVPDIANPFFSEVLHGIDETLSAAGYGILIANLDRSRAKDARYVALAASGQVDGVILLCGRTLGGRASSVALDVPTVAACELIPRANIPQVDVANRSAARMATAHLIDLGHRRIAYLAGPARNVLDRERRAGFLEATDAAGIPRTDVTLCAGDFSFRSGAVAASELFAMPDNRCPTAVFAANDEMAIGLIKRLGEHGLIVPRDVSVVGFDGIEFADYCVPALTTVRQPRSKIGAMAAQLIVDIMQNGAQEWPRLTRLNTELIVRGTTAPPRAAAPQPSLTRQAAHTI